MPVTDRLLFIIRHNIATAIVTLFFFIILPTSFIITRNVYALENTNVVRDIQLLLSLHGLYTGPIDGQCNDQTKQAITQYQKSSANWQGTESHDINCNVDSLNTIKADMGSLLNRANTQATSKEIEELKTRLNNTNAALKGITDGFASNFINQYNSLTSSGISAFITSISIIIALLSLASALLKDIIAKEVFGGSKKIVDNASEHLLALANIAHASLETKIYARLGGRIILSQLVNFYKDHNCPATRRDRYMAYLEGGAHIATVGNNSANALIRLYQAKNWEIPDDDAKWINACKNNFIFYVSAINDTYFNISKSEDTIKNVGDVANTIKEFEAMLSDNLKTLSLADNQETLIWAKLCLGIITGQVAKAQIELLARDCTISDVWKREVKERYEFYDRFPEHAGNKVNFTIA